MHHMGVVSGRPRDELDFSNAGAGKMGSQDLPARD